MGEVLRVNRELLLIWGREVVEDYGLPAVAPNLFRAICGKELPATIPLHLGRG